MHVSLVNYRFKNLREVRRMELIILFLCALKFKLEKSKNTVEIEDEFDVNE